MKSKYIVIAGILLGIGAIVRLLSLAVPGVITSNLVIAFYALAIVLILPTFTEAIGIGIVAGIICALISHSLFPPGNLISEPIGAVVALLTIVSLNRMSENTKRKDNVAGYGLTVVGTLALIAFGAMIVLIDLKMMKNPFGTGTTAGMYMLITGIVSIAILMAGLFLIPNTLGKYKAGVTSMIATLASGFTFAVIAAFIMTALPQYLNGAAPSLAKGVPPLDVFVLGMLPIVIGCALVNFVLAQVLYGPAKKAMR